MSKQKTAIRQLIENSINRDLTYWKLELSPAQEQGWDERTIICENMIAILLELKREAEELEEVNKQQIIDAHFQGGKDVSTRDMDDAEQYYNETYGSDDKE